MKNYSNLVIRAAAGTGKTYQLSNRYLTLAVDQERLDTIFASTFTTAATGEILNRVLCRLAQAALDEQKCAELSAALERNLTPERCQEVLLQMVHNLHRLRISTLDSFFNRMAKCFPFELHLTPGWRIISERLDKLTRWEALHRTLSEEPDQAVSILRQLQLRGQVKRNVGNDAINLINSCYRLVQDAPEEAWLALDPEHISGLLTAEKLEAALGTLDRFRRMSSEEITELGMSGRISDVLNKFYLNIETAREKNNWDELLIRNTLLEQVISESSPQYYSKPVAPELAQCLEKLYRHCVACYLRIIAFQTSATKKLLNWFSVHYEMLKQEKKELRFSDVTRAVSNFMNQGTLSALSWRLDGRISHLLLDEFQDTSSDQWKIIAPLSISSSQEDDHHSFFCVGDVKQAIYNWRGGNAEIFNEVKKCVHSVEERPLNKSYRSSQVVMDSVNQIFGNIAKYVPEKYRQAVDSWLEDFHPHTTARSSYPGYFQLRTSMAKIPQDVFQDEEDRMSEADREDYQLCKQMGATMESAAQLIQELREKLPPGSTVGILMRRKEAVRVMMQRLRKYGILASEEGGNPLSDIFSVRVILSLLKLADHPSDTISCFHVFHSQLRGYFPELSDVTLPEETGFGSTQWDLFLKERFREVAFSVRQQLLTYGYGETILRLCKYLKPYISEHERIRLEHLVKLAYSYKDEATLRPSDFVAHVEETLVPNPQSVNIKVSTIHGAKGLQYDAVILPDVTFSLQDRSMPLVVGRDTPTGEPSVITRYIKHECLQFAPPDIQNAQNAQAAAVKRETLSILYVALTRSVYATYVIIPPKETKSAKNSAEESSSMISQLLSLIFTGSSQCKQDAILFSMGNEQWYDVLKKERKTSDSSGKNESSEVLQTSGKKTETLDTGKKPYTVWSSCLLPDKIQLLSDSRSSRGLKRRSPSQGEARKGVNLERELRYNYRKAQSGTVLHEWFEKVQWLDDGLPEDDVLHKIAQRNGISTNTAERALHIFKDALRRPAISFFLTRKEFLGEYTQKLVQRGMIPEILDENILIRFLNGEVVRLGSADYQWRTLVEKELAVRINNEFLLGTIDRLIILECNGEVIWADISDYKSLDNVGEAVLEQEIQKRKPQLDDYRKMLACHYRFPEENIVTRLVFPYLGVVREC